MKNLRKAFLIVISLFMLSSCDKDPIQYKIEGTLIDQISKTSIANINIQLYQRVYQAGVLNNNYTYLTEVESDEKGNFSFEFERTRIYDIKFVVEHSKYYTKELVVPEQGLRTDEINISNIYLEAKGWLKIIINNNFVSNGETLNIFKSGFKSDCDVCCSNGNTSFFETGDTSLTCAVTGGSTVKLDYGEATASTSYSKEILCKRFDTTFFTINY